MPTGRLEGKISLGISEQFSTISQMCSNWFHFMSLAHLNSFKCRSNSETWRYKCVEGHAGGFYTTWQWAGGRDAGCTALIQNPKSQILKAVKAPEHHYTATPGKHLVHKIISNIT